jgi:hypothetical protein
MYFENFPTEFEMEIQESTYVISIITDGKPFGGRTGKI